DARNDIKRATEYYDNAIRINPESAEILYAQGLMFQRTRQFTKAIECYNKMIDLDPLDRVPFYNIGCIHFYNDKLGLAIEACTMTISKEENYNQKYYMRGLCNE